MSRRGGFTLIEVMIAVLVIAIALGASLNTLGSYVGFQARLNERYTAHGVAWNALMRCHIASVQSGGKDEGEAACHLSNIEEHSGVEWEWVTETTEVGGGMLFYEISVAPASRDSAVSGLKAWLKKPL